MFAFPGAQHMSGDDHEVIILRATSEDDKPILSDGYIRACSNHIDVCKSCKDDHESMMLGLERAIGEAIGTLPITKLVALITPIS